MKKINKNLKSKQAWIKVKDLSLGMQIALPKNQITLTATTNYPNLVKNISVLLEQARKGVVQQINTFLVQTYWHIGKQIVEFEQKGKGRAKYGEAILKRLSYDLTERFGRGFSVDNLENMRRFYTVFPKSETVFRNSNLNWSQYLRLMRIKDYDERSFYEIECAENNWSVRELSRQFDSALYERLALSRDKKGVRQLAKKGQVIEHPIDSLKNSYVLEFLGLEERYKYSELDLETAIIDNLEHFLLELGKGFMFVDRQKRITSGPNHYFIDLVFYNRLLKCFVLIDLKIGELKHQDIGQMQMYVNWYDRQVKAKDENPTVGLILCKEKNDFVIKYTLPKRNKKIFAREYKLYLPSKEELRKRLKSID